MKKFISILMSALLLLNLTSAIVMAQTQEITSIYTEAKTTEVSAGEDFEFEIYLSGTYDGYAINVSAYSGTEIKNIVPADRTIKVDKETDVWVISTMPGLECVDSEKALIATVTVSTSDLAAGELLLSLAKVNITNDSGDRINDYGSHIGKIVIKEKSIPVTGLTLDKTTATVETGDETLTLTPIFSPENATNKNLTWTSDNESVATVENGVVTLLKRGVVTITATTEDGGYTASCVVTINCSHRKGISYPAESSTCIKQGHEAYDVCEECGEIISGSDAKLPFADHTYIETADAQYLKTAATCNSKAVYYKSCSVCGVQSEVSFFEYGAFDNTNHVGGTYKVNQKEATCYAEGYTGDIYCAGCNTQLEAGTVIEKNAHNPASVWSTDENYHWKDCQTVGCGNIIAKAAHTGGEATCVKKAICSVCGVEYGTVNAENHKNTELRNVKSATEYETGYTGDLYCKDCEKIIEYGVVIPKLDHTHAMTHCNAVEATCQAEGNVEYWHCTKCNKNYADESGTTELLTVATSVNPDNHIGGTKIVGQKEATCYEEGYTGDTYCGDCNVKIKEGSVIAKTAHNPASVWSTDDHYHWKTCQTVGCGNIIDKAEHSGGTATCSHKAVCEVCGIEYGAIDANNHVNTEIRNAVEATCTQDGYSGDIYCKDCGEKVTDGTIIKAGHDYGDEYKSDAESHWKECVCGSIANKSAHAFGEWSVIKAATETEKGSKEKVCSVCEYKVKEDIPVISVEDNTANNEAENPTDKPETAVKPSDRVESPKTGAENDTVMYIVLLGISGFALIGTTIRRKKRVR